jgi:predicted small lipoprotein YifL
MKQLLVLSAVLVPLSLFIAGCGGSGGTDASPAKAEKAIDTGKQHLKEQGKNTMQEMMKKGQQRGAATK